MNRRPGTPSTRLRLRYVVTAGLISTLFLLPASAAAATRVVEMDNVGSDYFFRPVTISLAAPGDYVRWTNVSASEPHDILRRSRALPIDSPLIDPGDSYSRRFYAAGAYSYLCQVHSPGMNGSVWVPVKASPTSGTTATTFTIRWASQTAPTGFRYIVQKRNPGSSTYTTWRSNTSPSGTFTTSTRGTYSFRAKLLHISSGESSGYSRVRTITVG